MGIHMFKCYLILIEMMICTLLISGLYVIYSWAEDVKLKVMRNYSVSAPLKSITQEAAERPDLAKLCPFQLEFVGCGETLETAPYHLKMYPLVVSITHLPLSSGADSKCLVKKKTFLWYTSSFETELVDPVGEGRTTKIPPISYLWNGDTAVVNVYITFYNIITPTAGNFDESARGTCFVNLVNSDLAVEIVQANRFFTCDVETEVILQSRILNWELPYNEVRYYWLCEKSFCGDSNLGAPVFKFTVKVPCGETHNVSLEVNHWTSNKSSTYSSKLSFVLNPYNIFLSCEPSCRQVNPEHPLFIKATEEPNQGNTFTWSYPSDVVIGALCHSSFPSDVFVIEPHTLQPGRSYEFTAATQNGTAAVSVQTGVGISEADCDVTPPNGLAFLDRFNISCSCTSLAKPVTFWVYQGVHGYLVSTSSSQYMYNLEITETPIWVDIVDFMGWNRTVNLNLSLSYPTDRKMARILGSIPSRIHSLSVLILEEEYSAVANEIDSISQLSHLNIPFRWKHRLVHNLFQIKVCHWEGCIIKAANAIHRLSKQVKNGTLGVDDFIFKAGSTLFTLTQSFDVIAPKMNKTGAYKMLPMLRSIHNAARQAMTLIDPVLLYLFLEDDVRRIHYRKVQSGNTYARWAMANIGLFISSHTIHPAPPFKLISETENEEMTVMSHFPTYINCFLTSNYVGSHFKFKEDAIEKFKTPNTSVSVAIVSYKETFWWSQPKTESGEMFEVHVYQKSQDGWNWSHMVNPLGTVETYFQVMEINAGTINGVVRSPDQSVKPEDLDKYVNIHQVVVQRGYGTLSLFFSNNLFGKLQVFVNISTPPTYSGIHNYHYLTQNRIDFGYYYSGGLDDHIYIGILPESGVVRYSFNVSLIQCAVRSENIWKSELCHYERTERDTVVCFCSHLSLFNVQTMVPKHSLVPTQQIELYTAKPKFKFALVIILIISFIIVLLFAIAFFSDKKKSTVKAAIFLDDNYPGEEYPYLIGVYTGEKLFAGTSSRVALRLIGDEAISRVHILSSWWPKMKFSWGQDSWFILFTERRLGSVQQLELWHDNSGFFPDWFCSEIVVWDVETGAQIKFFIESWLTASNLHSAQSTSFVFKRSQHRTRKKWKPYVGSHFKTLTRQEHHWVSTFLLHPRSLYNHKERTLILTTTILVTTASSMGFFIMNLGPADEPVTTYGTQHFTMSIISMLVTSFVILFPIILFTKGNIQKLNQLTRPGHGSKKNKQKLEVKNTIIEYLSTPVTFMPIMTAETYSIKKPKQDWRSKCAIFFCSTVTFSSIFFIISLSWKVGRNKSILWFFVFTVALTLEALLMNPVQLFISAVLIAYFVRKSARDVVFVDLDPLRGTTSKRDPNEQLAANLHYRIKPMYKPLPSYKLSHIARKNNVDKFFDGFHVFSIILMFTWTSVVIYSLDIQLNYFKNKQLREQISRSRFSNMLDLAIVYNRTQYFDYLRATVLPALHHITWYNGKPLTVEWNEPQHTMNISQPTTRYRGFCSDYATKLVGVLQLRQQRIAPTKKIYVDSLFVKVFPTAYGYLTNWNEDKKLYLPKWEIPQKEEVYYRTFRHWSKRETRTGPLISPSRYVYSGSGYVENLHWSFGLSQSFVIDLELDGWLDNLTRSIFLSINLYNMYVDKFAMITIITEALPAGVYRSRTLIETASVSTERLSNEKIVFWSVIGLIFVLTLHVLRTAVVMSMKGPTKYLSTIKGFSDLALITSGICVIVSFIVRFFTFFSAFEEMEKAARDAHTSLYFAFEKHNVSLVFAGIFSVCIAVFGSFHVHKLMAVKALKRLLGHTAKLIIYLFCLILIIAMYVSINGYLFGTGDVLNFFYLVFFKETASIMEVNAPFSHFAISTAIFVLVVIVVIHLIVAILVFFYAQVAAAGPSTIPIQVLFPLLNPKSHKPVQTGVLQVPLRFEDKTKKSNLFGRWKKSKPMEEQQRVPEQLGMTNEEETSLSPVSLDGSLPSRRST